MQMKCIHPGNYPLLRGKTYDVLLHGGIAVVRGENGKLQYLLAMRFWPVKEDKENPPCQD